jgi:hypothetical protein
MFADSYIDLGLRYGRRVVTSVTGRAFLSPPDVSYAVDQDARARWTPE